MVGIVKDVNCFNPCFLGTCPQRALFIAQNPDKIDLFQSLFSWNLPSEGQRYRVDSVPDGVSILVFLELALRVGFPTNYTRQSGVSILVFLELALRAQTMTRKQKKPSCFNPCFLGTCPQSETRIEAGKAEIVFQSLFSWNLPSEIHQAIQESGFRPVSILVFLELALRG